MQKMQPVTIKDIARRLGVSASTVSRALRGSTEINENTRRLVQELAEELKYTPNPIALSLKEKRSKVIGVIVPEIANYFCSAVIAGIEDYAYNLGYHVVIFQSHEKYDREVASINLLASRRIDGLIISVSNETKKGNHLKELIERGVPVVMFDRICDEIDTPRVVTDDTGGAFDATCHLIEQGYRRIAHFTMASDLSVTRNRIKGYLQALKKYKIPVEKKWIIHNNFHFPDIRKALVKLLKTGPKPNAILATSERITMNCFEIIKEMGLHIPSDIAMVGFTDNPVSRLLVPPLTAVHQPTFDIGQSAARLLISMIENNTLQLRYKTIELTTTMEVRASSLKI
ncbi:MAG: LacI family transcriptional regulator [Chitinophagaceae bacterium]|nr:LacI family transcriptional regulator [Chitinophagaceae bacterium]